MNMIFQIILSLCLCIFYIKHSFVFIEGPGAGEPVNGTGGTVYGSG